MVPLPAALETVLLVAVLAGAGAVLRRAGRAWPVWVAIGAAGLGSVAAFVQRPAPVGAPLRGELPAPAGRDDLATSDACRSCHPREYATWHRTYHRTMTQPALPAAVRGDFEGTRLVEPGGAYALARSGGEFWVHRSDPRGRPLGSNRIVMMTGSHHFQSYWYRDPRGWFTQLPFVWLIRDGRWVRASDSFLQPPPGGPEQPARWNDQCLNCHNTAGRPAALYDEDRADTRAGELGIACEACHGPAAEHVARNKNPARRYRLHLGGARDATILNPEEAAPDASSAICGQCHAVFTWADSRQVNEVGDAYRPGDDLAPTRIVLRPRPDPRGAGELMLPPVGGAVVAATLDGPGGTCEGSVAGAGPGGIHLALDAPVAPGPGALRLGRLVVRGIVRPYEGGALLDVALDETLAREVFGLLGYHDRTPHAYDFGAFWRDGTVRSTGREYNGLLATPCFERGDMSCLSCHSMHESDPDDMLAEGMGGDRACLQCHAEYAARLESHSHHKAASSGSRCYNCHMPHTTFGLLGAIRAHRVDNPSAAVERDTGRPNACNLCHLDRTLAWTAGHVEAWYGDPQPALDPAEREVAAGVRWVLQGDAAQRAVAAWHMGWAPAQETSGTEWMAPYLALMLGDPYAAVRYVAARSLKTLPHFGDTPSDPFAPPPAWAGVQAAVAGRWREIATTLAGDELLLASPGALQTERLAELFARRDNRPTFIAE